MNDDKRLDCHCKPLERPTFVDHFDLYVPVEAVKKKL